MQFLEGSSGRSAITKVQALVILVILVVAAIVGVTYAVSRPQAVSVGVASTTDLGTANSPIEFTVIPTPSSATVKSVSWNFGDGSTQTTTGAQVSHTYAAGGSYLVEANASVSYTSGVVGYTSAVSDDQALLHVQVQTNLSQTASADGSVPSIGFPVSTNPGAPVFSTGATIAPVGGFLLSPANSNYTIQSYTWNFGNGFTKTVVANSSTSAPSENLTASYSAPGLYPVSLTITTNDSAGATDQISTTTTVAVQSSARPFELLSTKSGIVNPGVITLAEVSSGGPGTMDPIIDYGSEGEEIDTGVFQNLVQYNGSSTSTFLPQAAAQLPTVANGGISANSTIFNFTIRSGDTFSNGDPLTAYSVWYSEMRLLAFSGGNTYSWVVDQFLIPGVQNGTATYYGNNTYASGVASLKYSNATNTIAFHFNRPMNPTTVFQILASDIGCAIMDPKVMEAAGAGWTQSNWVSYALQDEPEDYNNNLAFNPSWIIGSGPFVIKSYTPGQSIELVPNPKYTPTPGIPAAQDDVVIEWVSNPNTALLLLQDGQADSASGLPNSDYPILQAMQSQGLINIYNFANTMSPQFYNLNIDANLSLQSTYFGTSFNEPANYFADIATRNVWIDAFDYSGYINDIMGDKTYNATFGVPYTGFIMPGESYYEPSSALGGAPQQNLQWAEGNFSESAWHDMKITIPVGYFILGPQGTYQAAAIEAWADALSQVSGGNITVTPVNINLNDYTQSLQGLPITWDYSTPDYPSGADYTSECFSQGGPLPGLMGYTEQNFQTLAPNNTGDVVVLDGKSYSQALVWQWIQGNLSAGGVAPNATAAKFFDTADFLGIKMNLYLYQDIASGFWYWRTWLGGIQNEEGPMLPGGGNTYVLWLTKS